MLATIEHLLGPNADDKSENTFSDEACQYRELKLQQLDATALRKIAGETEKIAWFLKINQVPEELEGLLLNLRTSLNGWFFHIVGVEDPEMDDLENQISYIKTSANIDKSVEALARHKLKIFGGTYVTWDKFRAFRRDEQDNQYPLPRLNYCSDLIHCSCEHHTGRNKQLHCPCFYWFSAATKF
ncbi:MAG: hypothetical protein P8Y53_18440 [Pseudolabrys sp.]